jgi:hypothetical protein
VTAIPFPYNILAVSNLPSQNQQQIYIQIFSHLQDQQQIIQPKKVTKSQIADELNQTEL